MSVLVDTLHDGYLVPEDLTARSEAREYVEGDEFLGDAFARERDWGANLVAESLARELGLGEYHRVPIARHVLDLGRLPGVTEAGTDHMSRRAISSALGARLTEAEVSGLLERYYVPLWKELVERVGRHLSDLESREPPEAGGGGDPKPPLVRIGVHTYDRFGRDERGEENERPPVSLLTGPFQAAAAGKSSEGTEEALMAESVRDSTADPILVECVLEACKGAGIDATWNDPYRLPEGSAEVRLHALFFLRHLRRRCEHEQATGGSEFGSSFLWDLLTMEPQRIWTLETLRRRLENEQILETAVEELSKLVAFERSAGVGDDYTGPWRPFSTVALEVRKDLVCEYDDEGQPVGLKPDEGRALAAIVARGVRTYYDRWRSNAR